MTRFARSFRRLGAAGLACLPLLLAVPAEAQRDSPVAASRFAISVDGVQIGVFSELTSEAGRAGKGQFITLAGGRTQGMELAAWHELVILGDIAAARKNATIIMYNASGAPVARYHLTDAWPQKLSLDSLLGQQVRTATVMLMYETLRVERD